MDFNRKSRKDERTKEESRADSIMESFEFRNPYSKKKERIKHFQIFTTTHAWNSSINLSPQ